MSKIHKLVAILVADVFGYSRLPAPMRIARSRCSGT
jgi:hypothetical protein